MPSHYKRKLTFAFTLTVTAINLAILFDTAFAQDNLDGLPSDLTELDMKSLMTLDLVVTSAGKKEQKISNVAAPVYVISSEDIHRSGATHIAEVLRGAPGVTVARIASNHWAVSIRGFNQLFNNKLLVLIDGVSVFSPTTNGVYWEATDIPLSTIERIEIVRGPGGVLWGSNAVNGIINIITKSAFAEQGTQVSLGGGTHEQGFGEVSYSAKANEDFAYKTYGSFKNRGSNHSVDEESALDNWQNGAVGIRTDHKLSERDSMMFSGDVFEEWENVQVTVPSETPPFVDKSTFQDDAKWQGVKALGKWHREFDSTSELEAKLSLVYKDRSQDFVSFNYGAYTAEIQHRFQPFTDHDVVYGTSYRYFTNEAEGSYAHIVDPEHRDTYYLTAFLQDEITLLPDLLKFTLGAKVERQSFTGVEVMPSARVLLTASESLSIWSAVSKAVAPPAILFEDASIPVAAFPLPDAPVLGVVTVNGDRDLESENLEAYEIGARANVRNDIYIDLAGFYNRHSDIFGQEPGEPYPGFFPGTSNPALIIPFNFANQLDGDSYGGELALNWKAANWISFITSYSFIKTDIDLNGGTDVNNETLIEDGTPQNQYSLKTQINFSEQWSFDTSLRYIDQVAYQSVDAYFELDTRIGWKATKSMEISFVGQNLLHNDHVEYESNLFGPPRTAIERAFYGMVTWRFN